MIDRIDRISEEIKREISSIIQNDIKDPRLPGFVSVVSVNVTRDLRYAKVFVSIYGSEEEKKNGISALKSAAGYIRREVGHRVQVRYTPEIHFELDDSIEHGARISRLLHDTIKQHGDDKKDDNEQDTDLT